MKTKDPSPNDLTHLQRRFDAWRRQRSKGTRIPEPLWEAAAQLARIHGASRIARVLRLGYAQLQGRLGPAESVAASGLAKVGVSAPFVEVAVEPCSSPAVCTLELENRSGGRMSIRLPHTHWTPMVALAQVLWRGGR